MEKVIIALVVSLSLGWLSATAPGAQEKSELFQQGETVYANNCAACHRHNGEGLPNTFPALAHSAFVTGDPAPVISVLLDGRRGSLGRMPAWQTRLTDQEIAGVVTYIRQNWGNQAATVTPEMVAKKRQGGK